MNMRKHFSMKLWNLKLSKAVVYSLLAKDCTNVSSFSSRQCDSYFVFILTNEEGFGESNKTFCGICSIFYCRLGLILVNLKCNSTNFKGRL